MIDTINPAEVPWRTADGRDMTIADMHPGHVLNAIAHLERTAAARYDTYLLRTLGRGGFGDCPDDVFEDILETDPLEWIETTPQMRALRAREAAFTPWDRVRARIRNEAYKRVTS